jgi:hypothetical protein
LAGRPPTARALTQKVRVLLTSDGPARLPPPAAPFVLPGYLPDIARIDCFSEPIVASTALGS